MIYLSIEEQFIYLFIYLFRFYLVGSDII